MRPRQKGQSTIELITVFILVTAGIIIMGPYILRSINAHFKLWENGVQDSMEERVVEGSFTPGPPGSCTCGETPGGCGVGGCLETEQYIANTGCTPPGCLRNFNRCEPNSTCCTLPIAGSCGTVNRSFPTSGPDCYFGERMMLKRCGSEGTDKKDSCVVDPTCDAKCLLSSVLLAKTDFCTDDDKNLDENLLYTMLDSSGDCSSTKCEIFCKGGTIRSGEDCVPIPTCVDGIQNGDESGTDCGGVISKCPACSCKVPLQMVVQSIYGDGDSDVFFDYTAGTIKQTQESGSWENYAPQRVSLVLSYLDGSVASYPNISMTIGGPTPFGEGWSGVIGSGPCTAASVTRLGNNNGFDCNHLWTSDGGGSRPGYVTFTDVMINFKIKDDIKAACPTGPKVPTNFACSAFSVPVDASTPWKKIGSIQYYIGSKVSGDAYSCIGLWDEDSGVWIAATSCKYGDLRECRSSPLNLSNRFLLTYPPCPSGQQGWANTCTAGCWGFLDNGFCINGNIPRF